MPSSSKRQEAFMRAVSHDKEFADKAGVPQEVGKDFEQADQAKKKKSRMDKMYPTHAKKEDK